MNTIQSELPAARPAPLLSDTPEIRRGRLLAELALASRCVGTARSLQHFVGLNPFAGLEDLPWAEAMRVASRTLGMRTTLDESVMRHAYATGRISAADLASAVAVHAGNGDARLTVNGRPVSVAELIVDDLLHGPVDPAPVRARRTLAEAIAPAAAAQIDRRTARWCAAYVDDGQASWTLPRRELGLYRAWRAIGHLEPGAPAALRRAVQAAPDDAAAAVLAALDHLGVPDAEIRNTLEAHLAAQPGWAAHLRGRDDAGADSGLLDLLALRLVQEAALLGPAAWLPSLAAPLAPASELSTRDRAAHLLTRWGGGTTRAVELDAVDAALRGVRTRRAAIWQDAYEAGYRRELLGRLATAPAPAAATPTAAQIVCCIDPRSEGLRRRLEEIGPYETFGFAGFFGVAMAFTPAGETAARAQCPVPVAPALSLAEEPSGQAGATLHRRLQRRRGLRAALHAAHAGGLGAFSLAELSGVIAAPLATARTASPGLISARRRRAGRPPADAARISLGHVPVADRATTAEGILRGIGLTDGFAPLVVFCGHASRTTNNPFASALDCGACGGHGGAPNARVAAALLGDPEVRAALAERGIDIPESTRFVAALHETTSDRVEFLDVDPAHDGALATLERDLRQAGRALAAERAARLPGGAAPRDRGDDWAQVFPEWGLAGNAALIVAPRSRTRGVDLGRRTFLHSYDPQGDPDGAVLEAILTAPLVVAHGLSAQYYGSTVDPSALGSGTKAVHNVVGGVGVTQAAGGDLLQGLPWQSVADGAELVHEPMRLLVLVEAPPERIEEILARHPEIARLVDGEWIRLLAHERAGAPWQRLLHGRWLDPATRHDLPEPQPTTTSHEGAR